MSQQNANVLEAYQLRFFLKGISPMIWRRLLIMNNSSLADLHHAIQISMGWSNTYLHQFDIWGKAYGIYYDGGISFPDNARKVCLQDFHFRINEKFAYEYNFFDHWEHEVRFEKVLPFDPKRTYPFCIGGHYVAPSEEGGGPNAFMELMDDHTPWDLEEKLVEALEDYEAEKDDDCLEETIENLRYWANRHIFDRKKINRQLQRYFNQQTDNQLTIGEVQDED
jgi:hypothetical protein